MASSCLIVGAGLAGITAGRRLREAGWKVTLLDKGRVPGGRMATRRIGQAVFDHGAQFFTVRDPRFQREVDRWLIEGIARTWFKQEGHTRYVGVGGMNSIPAELARGLDVHCSIHVESIDKGWQATARSGEVFEADALILTPPVEQSLALLPAQIPVALRAELLTIQYLPCFAVMAATTQSSRIPAPGYFRPESGEVAWLADNEQKGISTVPSITIHATPEFTAAYWDAPRDDVGNRLISSAAPWICGEIVERQVHRWKYSNVTGVHPERYLCVQDPQPVLFAGDAFGGPRVEGAYLSGLSAAEALLAL